MDKENPNKKGRDGAEFNLMMETYGTGRYGMKDKTVRVQLKFYEKHMEKLRKWINNTADKIETLKDNLKYEDLTIEQRAKAVRLLERN